MEAFVTHEFGNISQSRLQQTEKPNCGPHQLLVRVKAVSINPIDWKTRKGLGWGANAIKNKLPWVVGLDFAGEVEWVGRALNKHWFIGERVCGLQNMIANGGSFASTIVVDSKDITKIPLAVSYEQAAALPCAALTAWQGINALKLVGGEKLLITGGAGGVGHFAIQFAKSTGAEVSATSSISKFPILSELGANAIDYQDDSLAEKKHYFDAVFDTVGGDTGLYAISLLKNKKESRMISLPTITVEKIKEKAKRKKIQIDGMLVSMDAMQLQGILQLVKKNSLKIITEKTFAFDKIADAQHLSESGRSIGKIVVKL